MEVKSVKIFEAFDGKRFFDKKECLSYETFHIQRLKEKEEKEINEGLVNTVVNSIVKTKTQHIINSVDYNLYGVLDIYNVFVHHLNKVSSEIHKKGGLNGGANLIVVNPLNKLLVSSALNFNSRYQIVLNESLDENTVYVMNNKILETKLNKKDIRMFGVINITNKKIV